MDQQSGLSGRPCFSAACAGAFGGTARDLPWLSPSGNPGSDGCWDRLRVAFLLDGARAFGCVCPLWRFVVDAGYVLWHWCSGDRNHRAFGFKTHQADVGQGQAAVGNLCDFGGLDGLDLTRDHLAFFAKRSCRGDDQSASIAAASENHATGILGVVSRWNG